MSHLEFLIRKLRNTTELDDTDIAEISAAACRCKRNRCRHRNRARRRQAVQLLPFDQGFCVRSKTTEQGKRQILSVHIPGDLPDLQSLHLPVMDHELRTLSASTIGFVSHTAVRQLARSRPLIAEALWRQTLIDAVLFRDWIVNIGRRPAEQRLLHLFYRTSTAPGRCRTGEQRNLRPADDSNRPCRRHRTDASPCQPRAEVAAGTWVDSDATLGRHHRKHQPTI